MQFTDDESRSKFAKQAPHDHIMFKGDELRIYQIPQSPDRSREGSLAVGCKQSQHKLCSLWETTEVSMKFETLFEDVNFYLSGKTSDYLLQVWRQKIEEVVLYKVRGTPRKILMKLSCPPWMYKNLSDDYSYFLKPHEQHWIRTIDFTLGSHIGLQLIVSVFLQARTFQISEIVLEKSIKKKVKSSSF